MLMVEVVILLFGPLPIKTKHVINVKRKMRSNQDLFPCGPLGLKGFPSSVVIDSGAKPKK